MKESRGKVTIETSPVVDGDPQVTLVITAPKSEWLKVRKDLGEFPDSPGHVSYDFFSPFDKIVGRL